jgi:hypothetical protein
MSNRQHLRTHCLDCAATMWVLDEENGGCTRCVPCLRKYDQQIYLLREFMLRSEYGRS